MVTLFVGNLPFKTTDDELRATFSPFGQVDRAWVARDKETGRAHGFALVDMPEAAEALRARSGLNQQDVDGRTLKVCEARPGEDGPGI